MQTLLSHSQSRLSSDYMLSRLTLDPGQTQKRLGDGFYEQKLVTDAITSLTGRRFLPGYTSAEAEFKAMMEQGLAEAHTQNLIPGVALTTAQVAALKLLKKMVNALLGRNLKICLKRIIRRFKTY